MLNFKLVNSKPLVQCYYVQITVGHISWKLITAEKTETQDSRLVTLDQRPATWDLWSWIQNKRPRTSGARSRTWTQDLEPRTWNPELSWRPTIKNPDPRSPDQSLNFILHTAQGFLARTTFGIRKYSLQIDINVGINFFKQKIWFFIIYKFSFNGFKNRICFS